MARKSERIVFEREVRTPDGMRGFDVSWQQIGEAQADAAWLGGGEASRQGAVREGVRYRFTVWANAVEALALTTADRIVWSGEIYNIRERPRRQPGKADCAIVAETGVTQ